MATLVGVFNHLLEAGATIIVIDDNLDLLAAANYLVDMGPKGEPIVAAGRPEDAFPIACRGPWLAEYLGPDIGSESR